MWLYLIPLNIFLAIITFIIFYFRSPYLQFYVKYFCYNLAMILIALRAILVEGIFHPGSAENFYKICDRSYELSSRWFSVNVDVEGSENFPKGQNFVIVSNHQSSLDMFALMKTTPPNTTFMAKKELLFAPFFGLAAWLFGALFVNRGNSKSARKTMDEAVKRIRRKKINLWVFPEGTRSQTGTMLQFKKGAFHIAQQAEIPIVPVVISNYIPIFNKKNRTFIPGTMRVKILEPIPTVGLTTDDVAKLTNETRELMLKVFCDMGTISSHPNGVDMKLE